MRSASPVAWPAASSNIWPKRLDQAHACRLGGAIGHSRGAARQTGFCRAAHGVRGRARTVSWFRTYDQGRLRRAHERFRHALGHRYAGVQALSMRDHGPALYRLRQTARRRAASSRRMWKVFSARLRRARFHRLWEPLADKQRPRNGYAAKFAVPYLLAAGFVHGGVGLGAFTESAIRDERVLALAAKVKFVIDPDNPYPNNYNRPHQGNAERRSRDRGAAALFARRGAGATDASGCHRQVCAQRSAWRLEPRARRGGAEIARNVVQREN